MIELAIVRHGETSWNVEERMQGHRNIALNDNGLKQAARIARRLSMERWDKVISSDLQRASYTADSIASAAGVSHVSLDARLRERCFGRLEGTTSDERLAEWGEDWMKLEHGIESDESLSVRAFGFLEETQLSHPNGRIVLVTHGGWIRHVFGILFAGLEIGKPVNASFSLIRKEQGIWRCLLYNCSDHLKMD